MVQGDLPFLDVGPNPVQARGECNGSLNIAVFWDKNHIGVAHLRWQLPTPFHLSEESCQTRDRLVGQVAQHVVGYAVRPSRFVG